ncbi:Fic family protein [Paenibacillus sp. MMS18-CY102]|uniref:Fic family protein n=1 Tax=Paenibacillus sp. MMS18-CY102 TaxID=2682849 RepID=UPI001365E24A|nr:Fic family protein [Paenibacillus sp. MMS18-CY102]MWC30776.1 Fic family protein [Paenibacillus sp. MMS18-CY102]
MFSEINEKKWLLDQKRPFPVHTLRSIHEHMIVNWTYHSNAIEGNTLTLSETKVALEGITIGGKTIKEHLEVINHKEAILYVEEIVRRQEPFTESQIKNIHRLILKSIQDEHAGTYRKENVIISGATHIPPDFVLVSDCMEQLIHSYENWQTHAHAVERSALLHIEFVKIHPFIDGNGRTARLLLNFELMKNGYPPIVIEKEDRAEYYSTLYLAHTTGDAAPFIALITRTLVKTFDWYLRLV